MQRVDLNLPSTVSEALSGSERRIPVTVITGFLGAGKSTLINRVLARERHVRFGVVVNEFGEVPVESHIVEAQDGDLIELNNGCLCCVARNDLLRAVKRLRKRLDRVEHILVEASGLSDPVPVARTFLRGGSQAFELDTVACVIDAEGFEHARSEYDIVAWQAGQADCLVMNRLDALGEREKRRLREELGAVAPGVPAVDSVDEALASGYLARIAPVSGSAQRGAKQLCGDVGTADAPAATGNAVHDRETWRQDRSGSEWEPGALSGAGRRHEEVVAAWFHTRKPLCPEAFAELQRSLPAGVIRGKGVLRFSGKDGRRYKYRFQLVGSRRNLDAVRWKRGEERQSALVFIGKDFDADELTRRIRACEREGGEA